MRHPASALRACPFTAGLLAALGLLAAAPGAAAAPPANDDFADATVLAGELDGAVGTNREATAQAGEPDHAGYPGGKSVWFTWTAPHDGRATVDTFGSRFDTLLAVYTGNAVGALAEVASSDDVRGTPVSRVRFDAVAGTAYHIAVDGFSGKVGHLVVEVLLPPENDDFADAIALAPPDGAVTAVNLVATREPGEPRHGGAGRQSLWYTFTAAAAGALHVDTFTCDFDTILAVYRGNALGSLRRVALNDDVPQQLADGLLPFLSSYVTFPVRAGQTYHIALAGFDDAAGSALLRWMPVVTGTAGADVIAGGAGAAEIHAGRGADVVRGGGGGDMVFDGRGADRIEGGAGPDLLLAESGADALLGDAGADLLAARNDRGTDDLRGGRGDDRCRADRRDAVAGC